MQSPRQACDRTLEQAKGANFSENGCQAAFPLPKSRLAASRVAVRVADYRKLEPGPLEEIIFYDHPSGRHRIEMAMRWKAEQIRRAAPR